MPNEPIIPSLEMRQKLGWDGRHEVMARSIINEFSLKLPRDRELVRQLTMVRIQQGLTVRPSWEDDDA